MAYLAGSAYLEWLEAREGEGSLQKLWKRMASRRGGSFGTAFRGVFGRSPADLYNRFRAEVTASAIEEEKRLEAAGLSEGELWQRLEGGTVSPQVSPDGSRILARRDPTRAESYLAVWTTEETEEERGAGQRRKERERKLLEDVNEVPEKAVVPPPREPKWRLPRANGFSAQNPRWMPDGKRILFGRRAPDAQGVLRWDLYLWEPETGGVSRVTREADIVGADPAPDGKWAAGVRSRYGITDLVRWTSRRERRNRWPKRRRVRIPGSSGAIPAFPPTGGPSRPCCTGRAGGAWSWFRRAERPARSSRRDFRWVRRPGAPTDRGSSSRPTPRGSGTSFLSTRTRRAPARR